MALRKIVILGAGGYVGRRLSAHLASSGAFEPVPTGRAGMRTVLDATDRHALRRVLEDAYGVVNCVAGDAWTIVQSASALAGALDEMGESQPRLVHFSSMAAYGDVQGPVDERAPLSGDLGPYSQAKAQAERALSGVACSVVLRPGCVYGRGAPLWSRLVARLLMARRLGDMGEAAAACSNLVHVDDVAAAVERALLLPAPAGEVFNLAMRGAPSWNDYFLAYARALGIAPVPVIGAGRLWAERHLAGPVIKGLEIAARAAPASLRARVPARIPVSLLRLWRQDIRLDATHAEARLGLSWRPLEQALPEMAAADGR